MGSKWQLTPTIWAPEEEGAMFSNHGTSSLEAYLFLLCGLILGMWMRRAPTSFDQPDGALCWGHAVHVSLGSDAQGSGNRLSCRLQHLHSPHGLFNMLKVLWSHQTLV